MNKKLLFIIIPTILVLIVSAFFIAQQTIFTTLDTVSPGDNIIIQSGVGIIYTNCVGAIIAKFLPSGYQLEQSNIDYGLQSCENSLTTSTSNNKCASSFNIHIPDTTTDTQLYLIENIVCSGNILSYTKIINIDHPDTIAPSIGSVTISPTNPKKGDSIIVTATVSDDKGVDNFKINNLAYYCDGLTTCSHSRTFTTTDMQDTFYYDVYVTDINGNVFEREHQITLGGNMACTTGDKLSGTCTDNNIYRYSECNGVDYVPKDLICGIKFKCDEASRGCIPNECIDDEKRVCTNSTQIIVNKCINGIRMPTGLTCSEDKVWVVDTTNQCVKINKADVSNNMKYYSTKTKCENSLCSIQIAGSCTKGSSLILTGLLFLLIISTIIIIYKKKK